MENDFDIGMYARVLRAGLDSGYAFTSFGDIGREGGPRSCILRHDVDSELLGCGALLDVEKSLGVKATYFVMLRSTAYNLFCVEAVAMVRRILADGHWLGLHFMGERFEGAASSVIHDEVRREARWLEEEFGVPVKAVSFHQPTQQILDGQLDIPGLVNTYNRAQLGDYFYVSDTNMTWRHAHPVEIFSRGLHPRLQLLIHPMWWTSQPLPMLDKWRTVLEANQRAVVGHWQSRERTLQGIDLLSTRE